MILVGIMFFMCYLALGAHRRFVRPRRSLRGRLGHRHPRIVAFWSGSKFLRLRKNMRDRLDRHLMVVVRVYYYRFRFKSLPKSFINDETIQRKSDPYCSMPGFNFAPPIRFIIAHTNRWFLSCCRTWTSEFLILSVIPGTTSWVLVQDQTDNKV